MADPTITVFTYVVDTETTLLFTDIVTVLSYVGYDDLATYLIDSLGLFLIDSTGALLTDST